MTVQLCRFCGSERTSRSQARCGSCGGNEWRWRQEPDPQPASIDTVQSSKPSAEPVPEPPERVQSPTTEPDIDGFGILVNVFVGGAWVVALGLCALVVIVAVVATREGNRESRVERFKHGYETREDIEDHPEEYARVLKARAEEVQKKAQEAARRSQSTKTDPAEAEGIDGISTKQDPE